MLSEKDIYSHLKNGGDPEELYQAFLNELNAAKDKIEQEEREKVEAAEKENKIAEARKCAIDAAVSYFALVNPDIREKDISFVFDFWSKLKITQYTAEDPLSDLDAQSFTDLGQKLINILF